MAVVDFATRRIQRANSAFRELIGYSAAELAEGVDVALISLSPSDTVSGLEELRVTGRLGPAQKTYVRRDGSTRHAWVTCIVVPGAEGLGVAYAFDVTEQLRTVDALRESEERARRLAEASFEGLFIHEDAVILDVNDAIPAMFRSSRDAMIGVHAGQFVHPSCHALMMENVRKQYELPYELIGVRADGSLFPIEVLGKPIPFAGERLRVTAVRDLTERKRTEAALRDAESALQQGQKLESLGLLAGGIAHDFNNLLGVITGFAAIARRDVAEGSHAAFAIDEIDSAARRAAELTRQMLVYSGRSPKQIGPLSLNDVVREMARLISASFSKKIELELQLAEDLPVIGADRGQVEQVVMNLLTNAAEAIGEARGAVRVITSVETIGARALASPMPGEHLASGRYVSLAVRDDGCGMDESTRARIFDPFFTTKQTGRGLGLSAMLGILRGHRAGLRIESAPGAGSTFRVYFPADPSIAALPEHARGPHTEHARPGRVVLLAEDEPALRRAAREVLAAAGYLVLEATNGAEAIDLFQRHAAEIALVMLDLHMPIAGGREALEGIRAIDACARVLLTSGFDAHEVLDGLREHDVAFIAKPWGASELLAAVADAMERR